MVAILELLQSKEIVTFSEAERVQQTCQQLWWVRNAAGLSPDRFWYSDECAWSGPGFSEGGGGGQVMAVPQQGEVPWRAERIFGPGKALESWWLFSSDAAISRCCCFGAAGGVPCLSGCVPARWHSHGRGHHPHWAARLKAPMEKWRCLPVLIEKTCPVLSSSVLNHLHRRGVRSHIKMLRSQ